MESLFTKTPTLDITLDRKRTICLYMCGAQMLSAATGMIFYFFIRRNRVILIINTLSLFLAVLGFFGSLKIKRPYIVSHGFITTCVLGAFFLYQLIEAMFISISHQEKVVIFLISLPYVIDFIAGIFSVKLYLHMIKTHNELPESTHEQDNDLRRSLIQGMCVICMDSSSSVVFYPCGHKICCVRCSETFIKNQSVCPLCRRLIKDTIQVFE